MILANNGLFEKAKELYKNRQFDDALFILEKINKEEPGIEDVEFTLARIKARNKRTTNEAKETFLKILKSGDQYVTASLLELGIIEENNRNYAKARSYFNKIIKRENNPLAYIQLAKLEITIRNYDKAIQLLENISKNLKEESKYQGTILLELAKANRRNGDIDKASEYINILKEKKLNIDDNWIMLEKSKIEQARNNINVAIEILNNLLNTSIHEIVLGELIKLYINYERYDLAYKYNCELLNIKNPRSRFNVTNIDIFLKYKLGITSEFNYENVYYLKQVFLYSKEDAINHISQHLDENEEKIGQSIYCKDIDVEKLYDYALEKIKNLQPLQESMNDRYIIRCNRIVGMTMDKQPTDTIKIIVVPNTKDIITMYPIAAINNKIEIENNYTSSKQKVRESQIDKFNRRYAKIVN